MAVRQSRATVDSGGSTQSAYRTWSDHGPRRSRSRGVIASAAAVLVVGCGGGAPTEDAGAQTATAESTTSAPANTTTSAAVAATTTTAPAEPACGTAELSAGVELGQEYQMDLDGDGADDTVTAFFDPSVGVGNGGLLVEYAAGGSARMDRPVFGARHELAPFGMHDVDGDGTEELFIIEYVVDTGFDFADGQSSRVLVTPTATCLSEVRTDSVGEFRLATYPPQGILMQCEEGAVVLYDFYDTTSDGDFRVGIHRYELADGRWTNPPQTSEAIPQDEMLARPVFNCGDLELPAPIPPA
jgi:hypothetical protein